MWSDWSYYGHMPYMGGWAWGFHLVFWLVLLALIAVALFALVRYLRQGPPQAGRPGRSSALETLEGRYARGEIQREEFLEKKKDLEP